MCAPLPRAHGPPTVRRARTAPMTAPLACTLAREGCTLRYELVGPPEGEVILAIHGAGLDHGLWGPQRATLGMRHRLLLLDVRGHGESRPSLAPFTTERVLDDLEAVLDAARLERVVVMGQSMGGNLAQALVRRAPARVKAMILVDCACNSAPLTWAERLGLRLAPAMLALSPYDLLLRYSARSISRDPAVQAYCLAAMRRLTRDETLTVMQQTLSLVKEEPDYRIARPFVIVRGAQSTAGSIATQAPAWAAREPQCRGDVVLADAGHCVNLDQPGAFDEAVERFLAQLAP